MQRKILVFLIAVTSTFTWGCSKEPAADIDTESESDTGVADSDSETETDWYVGEITYFDTDPNSECPHPVVQKNCADGWCYIPAGCFIFGSPEDEPCRAAYEEGQAQVTLTHPFVMAKTEVTQKQWTDAGFPNPVQSPPNDNEPVGFLNWFETLAYCNCVFR